MKNLLLFSGLLATAPLAAQEFHLSGGYNGSNVVDAGQEKWVGRAGYQFGADFTFGSRWFVKPGVHLLVRNLNYTMSTGAGLPDQEFKYTNRSLAIPVMLGVRLLDPADDPGFNIYALGGPTALMSLNADLNNSALTAKTNNTQWYIGAGGGVELGFLFAEGGYNVAMSNVFKGSDFNTNPKVNYGYLIAGLRLKLAD